MTGQLQAVLQRSCQICRAGSMLCKVPPVLWEQVLLTEVPQLTFITLGTGEAEVPAGVLLETQWFDLSCLLIFPHCWNFGWSQDQQGAMSSRKICENVSLKSKLPSQLYIFYLCREGTFLGTITKMIPKGQGSVKAKRRSRTERDGNLGLVWTRNARQLGMVTLP